MRKFTLGFFALTAYGFAASAFAGEDLVFAVAEPGVLGMLAVGIAIAVAVRLRGRK